MFALFISIDLNVTRCLCSAILNNLSLGNSPRATSRSAALAPNIQRRPKGIVTIGKALLQLSFRIFTKTSIQGV